MRGVEERQIGIGAHDLHEDRQRDESRSVQWPEVGQTAVDFVHPHDRAELLRIQHELAEVPGRRTTARLRARGADEPTWRHFDVTAVNMVHDPAVGGIVAALTDASERMQAASLDALAAALLDEHHVIALATDESGIITAMNAGVCELLGVDAVEPVGRDVGEVVSPASGVVPLGVVQAKSTGSDWAGELDIVRRDGTAVAVTLHTRAIRDPATGYVGRSYVALDRSQTCGRSRRNMTVWSIDRASGSS